MNSKRIKKQQDQELFFGIISPVGALKKEVKNSLKTKLKNFNYDVEEIKISDLLKSLDGLTTVVQENNESLRINSLMDRGNEVRKNLKMVLH